MDAKAAVANELHAACRDVGFFYVKNHGTSSSSHWVLFDTATSFLYPLSIWNLTLPTGVPKEVYEGVLTRAGEWFDFPVRAPLILSSAKPCSGQITTHPAVPIMKDFLFF